MQNTFRNITDTIEADAHKIAGSPQADAQKGAGKLQVHLNDPTEFARVSLYSRPLHPANTASQFTPHPPFKHTFYNIRADNAHPAKLGKAQNFHRLIVEISKLSSFPRHTLSS